MSAILCAAAAIGRRKLITLTISSNTLNYELTAAGLAGYEAGITDLVVTVSAGVYLYSTDRTKPGLKLGVGFTTGDSIYIVNNGYILGGGGYGAGSSGSGTNGGTALQLFCNTVFNNAAGYIAGGGGGGGLWPTNFSSNTGPSLSSSTAGLSTSTKGLGGPNGGTGCVILDVGAGGFASGKGGDGGTANGTGGQGSIFSVSAGFTAVSGGGGGWGASGGTANFGSGSGTPYTILSPGSGGKAIDLNGYSLTGGGGNVWGTVA